MKQTLMFFFALVTTLVVASSNPAIVSSKTGKSITVDLTQYSNRDLTVTIKTDSGVTVHSEKITNSSAVRRYDLSNLENGDYVITLEEGNKLTSQKFSIDGAVIIDGDAAQVFKPSVQMDGSKLLVNSLLLGHKASLSIRDSEGNELHTNKISKVASYGQVFDLTALPKGEYFVNINTSGHNFTYPVVK